MKYLFLVITLISLSCLYANDLIIRRIIINGNENISTRDIQHVILSKEGNPANRNIINDDAKRIENLYTRRGYIVFKVNTPDIIPISNRYADVIFQIEEFSEPIFDNITIIGNSYFSESKIWELIERDKNQKLNLSAIDILVNQITNLYLSRGFLFVKIQTTPDDSQSSLTILINEGAIVTAENIIFRGNEITRDKVLLAETRIQSKQTITPDIITTATHRLMAKQYIQSAIILPVNNNTILIDIKEGKMTHLSAILGYSTSETNKNSFNGFINADLFNLLGTDRNLSFAWRNFDNVFTSVTLDYHESGPIQIPIAGDIRLYREERDSTSVRTEIGADVYYQYNNQKYGLLGGLNQLFPGSRRPKLLESQTEKIIGFFWEGDFTDDIINPRKGWHTKYEQRYLFVNRADDKLQRHKFEGHLANYFSLSRSWVVANKLTGIYLENKKLTEYDLIKVGGAFSIRGFYEDFFSGNTILYTNSELRYILNRYSRIFVFADYGYIEDNRPDIKTKHADVLGLGFGLRAETRIGLLRIDYGFHHANNKWLPPLNGIIHFGIETRF